MICLVLGATESIVKKKRLTHFLFVNGLCSRALKKSTQIKYIILSHFEAKEEKKNKEMMTKT